MKKTTLPKDSSQRAKTIVTIATGDVPLHTPSSHRKPIKVKALPRQKKK